MLKLEKRTKEHSVTPIEIGVNLITCVSRYLNVPPLCLANVERCKFKMV